MRSALNVTLDASFVVGFCAKEPDKYLIAQAELSHRVASGCSLHAPHLIMMETVYVLCGKHARNEMTLAEHAAAIVNLQMLAAHLIFPPGGDAALLARAEQIRQSYGCSRSADCFYIALAERLALSGPSELLTFDVGQKNQAAALAPAVQVMLLP